MTVILDTSFLFALTDRCDRNHNQVLNVARNINEPMLLPGVVLTEVCYLLASRLGHPVMRQFLGNLVVSGMEIEGIAIADLERVEQILQQYADSQLDFVDAVIATIAERENITCILTLDRRDFSMIRPRHCQYFQILPD
ncbi:type II toxin-antitoxin system VapC family toxin [Roseofilum sp. Belize Diploria]|uniref:type II toxin-antitoxin system VapC family toxin n=1 Tax=Roseofilum sp. Belize Diploria TaxID=2821501 RepID=UPI001B1FBD09|nr:PIN domain-containing protein [Roseofilum sp. Belize Diploria]MBP0008248.1 PIN domain-containing protein [Roseofilum sp. Belize Diploria]